MRPSLTRVGTAALVLFGVARAADAAQVRGVLEVEPEPIEVDSVPPMFSSTQIRVAQPARGFRSRRPDLALFLEVRDSLPLPEPPKTPEVRIRGFELAPTVTSCPVDSEVVFVNEGAQSFELRVGDRPIGRVAPEGRLGWVCETGAGGAESKTIRTVGHPFMTAEVYVGEVGVAARPDAEGRFALTAPAGTYRLLVISERGVVHEQPVEVQDRDVDLGVIRPGEAPR